MKFLDHAKIHLKSGHGGRGCVSFLRERCREYGGPDGGDGGHGGNILIQGQDNLTTLFDYRYQQHFRAPAGAPGAGKERTGASGKDIILPVPLGTQVWSEDKSVCLWDVMTCDPHVLLKGGRGGQGNAKFKSSRNQAPRFAQPGEDAQEMWVHLQLKIVAEVGLVGQPNVGKSTFLRRVSKARPKVADYPFTTLYPHLGVVTYHEHRWVMADIPGLLEHAFEGKGLGHRFLGHIERCRILMYLIDASSPCWQSDYTLLRKELTLYDAKVAQKPHAVLITKGDVVSPDVWKKRRAAFSPPCPVVGISAALDQDIPQALALIQHMRFPHA